MWIQSKDEFDCVAQFDPSTGSIEKHSRTKLAQHAPKWSELAGSFSEVHDDVFVLYRNDDRLIFRTNDNAFVLDGRTVVNVTGDGYKKRMCVERSEVAVLEFEYELVSSNAISDDPTPFVDDEDFDFGLFVSNISKSAERREVLLGKE